MLEIRNVTKIYKSKHANQVIALNNVSINFGDKGMCFYWVRVVVENLPFLIL